MGTPAGSVTMREGTAGGLNSFFSRSSRYTVFQREQGRLLEKEFALGIDNLRVSSEPGPWWTFHNDEVEWNRQAILVTQIRADTAFRRDFDTRLDALLTEHRLFKRGTDGYLTGLGSEMPADKNERLVQINVQLDQEGYVEGADKMLAQADMMPGETVLDISALIRLSLR